jgi:hypothetical protein
MKMPSDEVEDLWEAVTVLESQETLLSMKIATYPHISDSSRAELHREIFYQAYPHYLYPPKTIDAKDLMAQLGGL